MVNLGDLLANSKVEGQLQLGNENAAPDWIGHIRQIQQAQQEPKKSLVTESEMLAAGVLLAACVTHVKPAQIEAGEELIEGLTKGGGAAKAVEGLGLRASGALTEGEAAEHAFSPEKERISTGIEALVRRLTDDKPQTDASGKLQYYFGGSIGPNLLARFGKFTELESTSLPQIARGQTIELNTQARTSLQHFVRQIGDVDVVNMPDATLRYGKGGIGPAYSELSDSAVSAFKAPKEGHKIMFDPVSTAGSNHWVVAINIGDRDIFVTHPVSSVSWKMVHGLESLNYGKMGKMTDDFQHMYDAVATFTSHEQMVAHARNVLDTYSSSWVNGLYVRDYHPGYTGVLKSFVDDVVGAGQNAPYLRNLQFGRERMIGIDRVLRRLTSEPDKNAVIEFINRHRDLIDKWKFDDTSPANRTLIAREIMANNPSVIERMRSSFKINTGGRDIESEQDVVQALGVNTWAIDEVGKTLADPSVLDRAPVPSDTLQLLMALDPKHIEFELAELDYLLSRGCEPRHLDGILKSDLFKNTDARSSVFSALRSAAEKLPQDDLRRLTFQVYSGATSTLSKASDAERLDQIRQLFADHQIMM